MPPGFLPDDVRRLAVLSRLELTSDEIERFARQLSGILAFAAEVQSAATDGVELSRGTMIIERLRDDEVRPPLARQDALRASAGADRHAGFFTVPRVLGE